jgi:hypothetical protein
MDSITPHEEQAPKIYLTILQNLLLGRSFAPADRKTSTHADGMDAHRGHCIAITAYHTITVTTQAPAQCIIAADFRCEPMHEILHERMFQVPGAHAEAIAMERSYHPHARHPGGAAVRIAGKR